MCQYDHGALSELILVTRSNADATQKLAVSMDTLNHSHREMTRWLLIVVCIIALGTKAVETAKDIWGAKVVVAETK
jgi:hypothetical protein